MDDDTIDGSVFCSARRIAFSEVDASFRLRVPALLRRFQDAAARHSERIGLGIRRLSDTGRCWLLNRILIEPVAAPEYDEPLAIATWSRGRHGLRMRRDFEFTAGQRVVARGTSLWFLMDVERRRPIAVEGDVERAYGLGARDAIAASLADWMPSPIPRDATSFVFAPRDADFDAGRHVNNCIYAEWAFDACDRLDVAPPRVAELRIAFERAIPRGAPAANVVVTLDDRHVAGQVVADGQISARFEARLRAAHSTADSLP